jgi:hypothetical protein
MALARTDISVNSPAICARASADTIAPLMPWQNLAATSRVGDVASAQPHEASAKDAVPSMNIRRRPNSSPIRPPRSRKPPNAMK